MQTLVAHPHTARFRARTWSVAILLFALALPHLALATRARPAAGLVGTDTANTSQHTGRGAERVAQRSKKRKVRKKRSPASATKRSPRAKKRRAVRRAPRTKPARPGDGLLLDDDLAPHRVAVVQTALALEGAPYAYASKGPTRFDCSGFTHFVLKQHGVTVTGGSRHQAQQGRAIAWRSAQPGDLVFFRRKGKIRHVGLVVKNAAGELWVAHATNRGVVVDDVLASSYWRPQLSGARTVL